jgi:hypothetical protein
MQEQKAQFNQLAHTQQLSNRTYLSKFEREKFPDGGFIYSEGAWKIGLTYGVQSGVTNRPIITVNDGESFELNDLFISSDQVRPEAVLWLDGTPEIVRDDILQFNWINDQDCTLYVFFHRLVWKKDKQFYPAVSANQEIQNKLNSQG